MDIIIHQAIEVRNLSGRCERMIKKDLTFKNPRHTADMEQGRHWTEEPEYLSIFEQTDKTLVLPRGYVSRLKALSKNLGEPIKCQNNTLLLPPVSFKSKIRLNEYQGPAVSAMVSAKQGGISAPCGSGKTVMLLEAIARIGQPTLWVTHTKELLDQAIERAVQFLDLEEDEIGRIESGKVILGDRLTVALVQTLNNQDERLANKFGCVVVDEAHHLAARTFFNTVGKYPALYRLWASATPERSDGLTSFVTAAGGDIVHEIQQSQIDSVMVPSLKVVKTNHQQQNGDYQKALTALVGDVKRNRLIARHVLAESCGNYSLVLSDRVEHLRYLKALIEQASPYLTVEILTGKMSKKQRQEIMEQAKAKEIDVLLATQLAREGLDLTHLNRLFLTTPKRAAGATQQEVGRIMRKCEGKTNCKVIDFFDDDTFFAGGFWARRKVYEKLGMDVSQF